jgi:hypothetical protein
LLFWGGGWGGGRWGCCVYVCVCVCVCVYVCVCVCVCEHWYKQRVQCQTIQRVSIQMIEYLQYYVCVCVGEGVGVCVWLKGPPLYKVTYRGRDTVATLYNAYMAIFNTKVEITNSTLFSLFLDV